MRVAIFSDVHDLEVIQRKHQPAIELQLPECDLALFCGDACNRGSWNEWRRFCAWYGRQKATYKIAIAGNHDDPLAHAKRYWAIHEAEQNAIIYLQDSSVELLGLHIYGSPWTPYFGATQTFHFPRQSQGLRANWDRVPTDTDILLTHGPAFGLLDKVADTSRHHQGDELLLSALDRIKPRLHAFGHLHDDYGILQYGPTQLVNGCLVDRSLALVRAPIVIDL